MNRFQLQAQEIRNLLNKSDFYEGRHYVEMLLQQLEKSKKSPKTIEHLGDKLYILVNSIIELRKIAETQNISPEIKEKQIASRLKKMHYSYKAMVKATGHGGILYKCKELVLALGGAILGTILASIGSLIGFFMGLGQDLLYLRKPTGAVPGAMEGIAIGLLIGYRIPFSLFNKRESRALDLYVYNIGQTFETLKDSLLTDCLQHYKNKTLKELFNNDQTMLDEYCNSIHPFKIITFPAPALTSKHKGIAGNHAVIQISINGHTKLIELGRPSTERDFKGYKLDGVGGVNQTEMRQATGEQILKMLAFDRLLQKRYEYHDGKKLNRKNLRNLFTLFSPGVDDCHTYADKILAVINQPPIILNRITTKDFIMGRAIGRAIQFFSPAGPDKFKYGEPVNNLTLKM